MRRIGYTHAFLLIFALAASSAHAGLVQRADVRAFIDEMAKDHKLSRNELRQVFEQVKTQPDIIDAISRPAESKPWYKYRPIFVTEKRIREGIEFWHEHAAALDRAEATYGVPPRIIVAILGVETRYGRHKGTYRVVDALATLAFDYPPRSSFFKGQLEQYLLMAEEENVSPLSLHGSYAGAMGQPQFIPSSFRSYAVDFDKDGHRDLWDDPDDVIGSVANYFQRHGWIPGQPVAHPAQVHGDKFQKLLDAGVKPNIPAGELAKYGVDIQGTIPADEPVALIALEQEAGPEYWVVRKNFYVITRYNHSSLYAMAVHQLSQGIRTGMK